MDLMYLGSHISSCEHQKRYWEELDEV
jgi:hypothetical protein